MRDILAGLLILIGAILTFPASLAVWEQRVLTDRDRFVALGQDALRDDAVQDELTARITDEVIEIAEANGLAAGPASSEAVARIEPLTRLVVSQLPDSSLGRGVLETAHFVLIAFIDNDSQALSSSGNEVRVNFRPAVEQVLESFRLIVPALYAAELPPRTGEIVIVEERDVAIAFRAARWFDGAAVYIALLPLLAFAAAFFTASNRQVALFFTGLLVALTAVFRIALYEWPLQRVVSDSAVDERRLRAAALGVYDAVAASLVAQDMPLLAAGIALVVVGVVWWGAKRRWSNK